MLTKKLIIECNGIVQQLIIGYPIEPSNLTQILQALFQFHNNQIIGIIDQQSKFYYDIESFCQNLKSFKNQQFKLLLSNQKQEKQSHSFSKDRGQSQQGKRQRNLNLSSGNYQNARSQHFSPRLDDSEYNPRLGSRSHSILNILPENVKYFEDYEFFVKTVQQENPQQYFMIWFFDTQEKMRDYQFLQNPQLFNRFQQIQHYTGLYPSFRSVPFGKIEDSFCLSFFKGAQMIFERDLDDQYPVPLNILDLIEEQINITSAPNWMQRSSSPHATSHTSNHHQNDEIQEIIDMLNQYNIRSQFSEQEFKDLIKIARKQNKAMIGALESYRVYGDEQEFQETLKKIISNSENNLEVSFDKDDSSNFIPPKSQVYQENVFTHTLINTEQTNLQNDQNLSEYDMVGEIIGPIQGTTFFLKQYFKSSKINNQFTFEEQAFLVLALKDQNQELKQLIKTSDQEGVLFEIIGINRLKNFAQEYSKIIYQKEFSAEVVDLIQQKKYDIFSFVSGAFCNLISFGDFEDFKKIILENINKQDINNIGISPVQPKQDNYVIQENTDLKDNSEKQYVDFPTVIQELPENNNNIDNEQAAPINSLFSKKSNSPAKSNKSQSRQISIFGNNSSSSPNNRKNSNQQSIRKKSSKGSIDFSAQNYSTVAREVKRQRRPTFVLKNNNEVECPSPQKLDEKQIMIQIKMIDQHMNYLIDKYNQSQDQENFNNKYQKVYELCYNSIDSQYQNMFQELYKARIHPIIKFLENVKQCEHFLQENKDKLILAIEQHKHMINQEEYEMPSQFDISPRIRVRVNKYKTFKKVLKYLFEIERYISQKDYHFFHYLYIKDDINTLAAFEVYTLTQDIKDFVENLSQILKQQYFRKDYSSEEIEEFDQEVEQQLGILFTFKKDLNISQRLGLEKSIKLRDTTLLDLYRDYKKNGDRNRFLQLIRHFANQRVQEFKERGDYDDDDTQSEVEEERNTVEDQIHTLHTLKAAKILNNVNMGLLEELCENEDKRMVALFEVLQYNNDKGDFVENIKLLHSKYFRTKLEKTVRAMDLGPDVNCHQVSQILLDIENNSSVINGAFEFYLDKQDLDEFKDTIQRICLTK